MIKIRAGTCQHKNTSNMDLDVRNLTSAVSFVPDEVYETGGAVWNKQCKRSRVKIAADGLRVDVLEEDSGKFNLAVPISK